MEKGSRLENLVKLLFKESEFAVEPHFVNRPGLDVVACNRDDEHYIVECLNWERGYYVHPDRFLSLIRNLSRLAYKKFLVAFGAEFNEEQCHTLHAMKIKLIRFPEQLLEVTHSIESILKKKLSLGVVTSNTSNNNNTTSKTVNTVSSTFKLFVDYLAGNLQLMKALLGRRHTDSLDDSLHDQVLSLNTKV